MPSVCAEKRGRAPVGSCQAGNCSAGSRDSGFDGFKRGLAETVAWFAQPDSLKSYKPDCTICEYRAFRNDGSRGDRGHPARCRPWTR